jgi:hypothetical protein
MKVRLALVNEFFLSHRHCLGGILHHFKIHRLSHLLERRDPSFGDREPTIDHGKRYSVAEHSACLVRAGLAA